MEEYGPLKTSLPVPNNDDCFVRHTETALDVLSLGASGFVSSASIPPLITFPLEKHLSRRTRSSS